MLNEWFYPGSVAEYPMDFSPHPLNKIGIKISYGGNDDFSRNVSALGVSGCEMGPNVLYLVLFPGI